MAKSLRSKIKRKFRTELRKKIGVPHQAKQEQSIQENLRKAIESQTNGSSMMGLKALMGSSAPVAVAEKDSMEVDSDSLAQAEATALDETSTLTAKEIKKILKSKHKKPANRKKKQLQFHPLRKKGV